MEVISKGFFWLSALLILIGTVIGRGIGTFFLPLFEVIRGFDSGFYIIFFGVGIPLAFLHLYEEKKIWRHVFKSSQLNILGLSAGIAVGIITKY